MSSEYIAFTKDNLDKYLGEVAKKYRKITGKRIPAEMILIGGASILVNYGFRDSTTDIDAIIDGASSMKEAINYVGDKYGLPDGWLNADFKRTTSYSHKLIQFSKYYRTFSNVLTIRTVSGEYLIAMKLISGRKYKHDLSDIIGILDDEKKNGNCISLDQIIRAYEELYGSWDELSAESKEYINSIINNGDYGEMFSKVTESEKNTRNSILEFRREHPEESKGKTANEIIEQLRESDDLHDSCSRCVIVGGTDIGDYKRVRGYLRDEDYVIFCDSGLRHMEGLGVEPSLIVGDFDSFDDPHLDVETITLPVAKDDTDTVYAVREGKKRGFTDFLLLGVFGARLDHTLVNTYILFDLDSCGCSAMAVDDYSEISVVSAHRDEDTKDGRAIPGTVYVKDGYPFFSLLNMTGTARGVTIRNAKFCIEDAEITSEYQYATSNEVIPGQTTEITIREGRLLLVKITGKESITGR